MMKEEMNQPLVSVGVVAYNSSNTILQTLESVKQQTYRNIELIISDDCSSDNTVKICRDWIAENKDRFVRIELITVEKNTGVSANCNRTVKASSSEWIKMIAGDDILLDNCVEVFINYIFSSDKTIEVVYSSFYEFTSNGSKNTIGLLKPDKQFNNEFNFKSNQFKVYIKYGINITPSLFWKKELIERMGFFDERYTLFEDFPMIAKVLYSKINIYFINTPTVLYRIGHSSITKSIDSNMYFYKRNFMDQLLKYRKEVLHSYYAKKEIFFWINEFFYFSTYYFTIYVLRNKKNCFTSFIRHLYMASNPIWLYKKLSNYFIRK